MAQVFPTKGNLIATKKSLELAKTGFDAFLKDWAAQNKPLLGICLGSQIIFDWSEEGETECLGLIKGKIKLFDSIDKDVLKAQGLKVPHMGWNNLEYMNGECKILKDVPETSDFYFVHSYHVIPDDSEIIAGVCDYGIDVVASLSQNNLFSTQFHPEKSGKAGLKILKNFVNIKE